MDETVAHILAPVSKGKYDVPTKAHREKSTFLPTAVVRFKYLCRTVQAKPIALSGCCVQLLLISKEKVTVSLHMKI